MSGGGCSCGWDVGVLIVDDDRSVASWIQEIVDRTGVADWSAIACTETELEEILAERTPTILFVDIVLWPGVDGRLVARKVRQKNQNAVVVVVTGFPERLFDRELLDVPIDDYVLKPVNADKVAGTVVRAYTRYRRRVRITDCLDARNRNYEEALAKLRELERLARKLIQTREENDS